MTCSGLTASLPLVSDLAGVTGVTGALWDINGRSSRITVGEGERVTGGFSPISTVEQTWKAREAWLL